MVRFAVEHLVVTRDVSIGALRAHRLHALCVAPIACQPWIAVGAGHRGHPDGARGGYGREKQRQEKNRMPDALHFACPHHGDLVASSLAASFVSTAIGGRNSS